MGPGADVLLPAPLGAADHARIAEEIAAVAGRMEESEDTIDFWIDGRPLTLLYDSRYGDAALRDCYLEQLSDYDGLETVTGWAVREYLSLYAGCNDIEDHRVLAGSCIHIAELFQGLIAFGMSLDRYTGDRDLLAHPGAIHWTKCNDQHLLTPEFTRLWLRHPDFRMVK